MMPSFHRPHVTVGPLLCEQSLMIVVDALWGCGQRDSVVHQIHSIGLFAGLQVQRSSSLSRP
jgi:hypothetical protein